MNEQNSTWTAVCVICAARDRRTELHSGHICGYCLQGITRALTRIEDSVRQPLQAVKGTSSGAPCFESRPPTNLDQIAPHMATYTTIHGVRTTVTDTLEEWARLIREMRGYAPYGVATEGQWRQSGIVNAETVFYQSVKIIRINLAWAAEDAGFPIEEFHDEITYLARHVRTAADQSKAGTRIVECPSLDCDGFIHVRIWAPVEHDSSIGEMTTCRSCGVVRTAAQLLAAAGGDETYADAEALANHFGISQTVIRKWARQGKIRKKDVRYCWSDVRQHAAERLLI